MLDLKPALFYTHAVGIKDRRYLRQLRTQKVRKGGRSGWGNGHLGVNPDERVQVGFASQTLSDPMLLRENPENRTRRLLVEHLKVEAPSAQEGRGGGQLNTHRRQSTGCQKPH